jgi:hypothetical protein
MAWLLPAHTAEAAAHFLRTIVGPHYRRAGWRLRRVLTDGGPAFRGAFDEASPSSAPPHADEAPACLDQRVRGAVARRDPPGALAVVFRRRYFTTRTALQWSLDGFIHSYNHERPHQGYRVRGRTPAALFWGAASA